MKTQQQKIAKVEALFDQIKKLFPDKSISLSIHEIDMEKLPDGWDIKADYIEDIKHHFLTARRNKEHFDITLFN